MEVDGDGKKGRESVIIDLYISQGEEGNKFIFKKEIGNEFGS